MGGYGGMPEGGRERKGWERKEGREGKREGERERAEQEGREEGVIREEDMAG